MAINPSGLIQEPLGGAYNSHWHAPGFGGEIAWNDIQLITRLNGEIRRANFNLVKRFNPSWTLEEVEAATEQDQARFAIKRMLAPYVLPMDPNGYPVQGYNQHGHTNEFDGGGVYGGGNHDHRGAGYQGYSFAVFHPGTRIPMRSLKIDS